MITFEMLSSEMKSLILVFVYLLLIVEFLHILIMYEHEKLKQGISVFFLMILTFGCLISLDTDFYEHSGLLIHVPVILIVTVLSCVIVAVFYQFIRELGSEKKDLNHDSIKEAFDSLPVGLCFFDMNGIVTLCNQKMYDLAYILSGKDLQTMDELNRALIHPADHVECISNGNEKVYRLPDDSSWTIHNSKLVLEDQSQYWQYYATDVTELYALQKDLRTGNEEVEDMIRQMQRINENVAVIVRQQEILNAKMRIHNKMGNCLLLARQYFLQDMPDQKKNQLVDLWKESLDALMSEVGNEDDTDACNEVIRIAKKIGVDVKIEGEMPEDAKLAYLFVVALRECVTNAVRHAKATQLTMRIHYSSRYVECIYTNNGNPPENHIVEGGGLTSLRQKINHANGRMYVQSEPEFALRVQLPLHEETLL